MPEQAQESEVEAKAPRGEADEVTLAASRSST